ASSHPRKHHLNEQTKKRENPPGKTAGLSAV
ncbi:hypothetical protein M2360_004793, partial [Rhizobium sp. SG_E_25_P2]|nr:hypothetical protein [Rhizobium sp. SG_E_25_P2]MDH6269365.1 hypothetical protein [Rhizobium sp. SG_E_25_P2]